MQLGTDSQPSYTQLGITPQPSYPPLGNSVQPSYPPLGTIVQPGYPPLGTAVQPSYNQFSNSNGFLLQTTHAQVSLPQNFSRVAIPSPPQINSTPPSMKDQLVDIIREYCLASRAYQ